MATNAMLFSLRQTYTTPQDTLWIG